VMHDEPVFADFFVKYLLTRSMRTRPISSISSSIPAKSAWPEFSF